MNESEWLAAENPIAMIRAVRERVTERKLRLCCCALCRGIWDQFADERCRRAVEAAERCADGVAAPEELNAARAEVSRVGEPYRLARRNQPAWVQAAWMTV